MFYFSLLKHRPNPALISPCSWPWRWWRRGWGCSWTLAASGPPAWWRGWLRTDWLWLGWADKSQNCERKHLSWLMNIKTKNTVVIFALSFDLIIWLNVFYKRLLIRQWHYASLVHCSAFFDITTRGRQSQTIPDLSLCDFTNLLLLGKAGCVPC